MSNETLRKEPISKIVFKKGEDYNVRAFRYIADEMVDTYKKKNADYGNAYEAGFAKFGSTQLLSRIYEKFERLYSLLYLNKDAQVSDESVCDTLTDMAIQCIVLRMLLKGENVQPVDFENVK